MSDRNDETISFGRGGDMPPTATTPIYLPGDEPPRRGRQVLLYLLVFLLGLAAGFVGSQFTQQEDSTLPDDDVVLYENASVTFPIEGAAFTDSTYDPNTQRCDK